VARHRSVLSAVGLLWLMAATGLSGLPAFAAGGPGPLTLTPTDDARVTQGSPNRNFGNETTLLVDSSPVHGSFLRFDL